PDERGAGQLGHLDLGHPGVVAGPEGLGQAGAGLVVVGGVGGVVEPVGEHVAGHRPQHLGHEGHDHDALDAAVGLLAQAALEQRDGDGEEDRDEGQRRPGVPGQPGGADRHDEQVGRRREGPGVAGHLLPGRQPEARGQLAHRASAGPGPAPWVGHPPLCTARITSRFRLPATGGPPRAGGRGAGVAAGPWAAGGGGAPAPTGPPTTEPPAAAGGGDGGGRPATCPEPGDGAVPWEDGPSAELVTLAEGGDGEPRVRAAVHPLPDHEGDPWSQWGQGVVLPDGRSLSAVGDHLGRDGNSYLYELDPEAGRLTLVADVASVAGHEPGDWGYGKVHAQMVVGPCGEVYATTYWGTRDGIEYGGSYEGDVLLRIDPERRTTESLGPVLAGHGVPSLAGWAAGGLLYAEAADPERFDPQRGAFVLLDMATGEQVFATPDEEDHRGFRAMAVDADGRVVFSRTDGRLARWDPATGELGDLDIQLPG